MKMRGLFITGTDTGIGKTFISAALMAASNRTTYWKPLQTGPLSDHDTPWVAEHASLPNERILNEGYRFDEPASPHHAAALEKASVDVDWLCSLVTPHLETKDTWIVEGVGGLLVPLNEKQLLPDFISTLGLPALVVASTKLGGINHALMTIAQLEQLQIPILGIILNGPDDPSLTTALDAHCHHPIIGRVDLHSNVSPSVIKEVGEQLMSSTTLSEVLR